MWTTQTKCPSCYASYPPPSILLYLSQAPSPLVIHIGMGQLHSPHPGVDIASSRLLTGSSLPGHYGASLEHQSGQQNVQTEPWQLTLLSGFRLVPPGQSWRNGQWWPKHSQNPVNLWRLQWQIIHTDQLQQLKCANWNQWSFVTHCLLTNPVMSPPYSVPDIFRSAQEIETCLLEIHGPVPSQVSRVIMGSL